MYCKGKTQQPKTDYAKLHSMLIMLVTLCDLAHVQLYMYYSMLIRFSYFVCDLAHVHLYVFNLV